MKVMGLMSKEKRDAKRQAKYAAVLNQFCQCLKELVPKLPAKEVKK